MSYIIKNADDLKDPFLCFCVFLRFMREAGEDYIDYNTFVVSSAPFVMWMLGKGYIDGKMATKLTNGEHADLQAVLMDGTLFPKTYGECDMGVYKAYALLAEYMSSLSYCRKNLYASVTDEASGFTDDKFYTDENGVSLACIIDDEDMVAEDNPMKKLIRMRKNFHDLSYREIWNIVSGMSIKEADKFKI